MVKLKEISRNGKVFSCMAYVENCKEPIHLVYNVDTGETEPFRFPQGYEYCTSHITHAKRYFEKCSNLEKIPNETTIMWY